MTTPIVYLHGANASTTSFTYLREKIGNPLDIALTYDAEDGLAENIEKTCAQCEALFDEPIDIIGHSLGGVLAVALRRTGLPVRRIITMSTPFGGSGAANYLKWFYPASRVFDDISPNNALLASLRATPLDIPVDSFITTGGGSPLFQENNDGVVTARSQRALPGAVHHEVGLNHFEILLSQQVALDIKRILENPYGQVSQSKLSERV